MQYWDSGVTTGGPGQKPDRTKKWPGLSDCGMVSGGLICSNSSHNLLELSCKFVQILLVIYLKFLKKSSNFSINLYFVKFLKIKNEKTDFFRGRDKTKRILAFVLTQN